MNCSWFLDAAICKMDCPVGVKELILAGVFYRIFAASSVLPYDAASKMVSFFCRGLGYSIRSSSMRP